MTRNQHIPRWILGLLLLLLPAALSPLPIRAENPPPDFYYFNPDSLQSNLNQLKSEMDGFFSRSGYPVNFQPFARLIDFDQKIKEKRPAFLFLPHWYYEKYGALHKLQPVLQPSLNNKKTYSKVLLARKNTAVTITSLRNRTLAMTSMGPDEEKILDRIVFQNLGLSAREQRIVIVPKDADAVFALALGQVETALVVKQNLIPLAAVNERLMQSITTIVESQPLPMPLLCFSEGAVAKEQVERMKTLFLKTNTALQPVKIMEMLQVDEWQAYGD